MSSCGQAFIHSATIRGIEAIHVNVEVAVTYGMPGFYIVGLADSAVQEARPRVKQAIKAVGLKFPGDQIIVNLSPCSIKKTGSAFDLPIALGILIASGQIDASIVNGRLFVGELSIDGAINEINGLMAFSKLADDLSLDLIGPNSVASFCVFGKNKNYTVDSLGDFLGSDIEHRDRKSEEDEDFEEDENLDYRDIDSHAYAKRALQIAAAGKHAILMIGPPGSGKTMLAQRLPTIMPPLNHEEKIESALIYSICGLNYKNITKDKPPFRMPHHSATRAGLIGGGSPILPGEISMAHNGVLFLDEMPEFGSSSLQLLRQAIESKEIVLARADGSFRFPSDFLLVGASNPCPCGYYGDREINCKCSESQVRAYQNRIGGPLLDRFSMVINVPRLKAKNVLDTGRGSSSEELKEGVISARQFSRMRKSEFEERNLADDDGSNLGEAKKLLLECDLSKMHREQFEKQAEIMNLSGRGIIRTLAIARTIADIENSTRVDDQHLAEALAYRGGF